MKVVVIGGGVVGLCCAREISNRGGEVTLVERGRCGGAASLRNAGQIVPSLCIPLAAPGVMKQALSWMLKPNSPLRIRPRLDPGFLLWLLRFATNSSETRYREALKSALTLGSNAHRLFDELQADGVEFEMHEKGIIFAALSEETLREDVDMYRELEAAGYDGEYELFHGEEVRRLEPALSDAVVGGLHIKMERHVRPESLMQGLVEHLEAKEVEILEGYEVYGLSRENWGGWRVLTSEGELVADRVLMTAGVWSKRLLSELGVRIPLEAGKGYSVTATGQGTPPVHPLKLAEAQVVIAPYGDGVRVSGVFELSGIDLSLKPGRIEAVIRAASPYLRDWNPGKPRLEWAGLRPATPDSLPLIGPVPGLSNLYVATGHGMLGVTHAPATSKLIAKAILEDQIMPELESFKIDRFSSPWWKLPADYIRSASR